MTRLVRFAVRSVRHLVFVAAVGAVVLAVVVVVFGLGGRSATTPAPAATPTAKQTTAAGGECGRVGAGFARAFLDRDAPDDEWFTNVASWVTPDLAQQLPWIDRSLVPDVTPTGIRVQEQPGSCDVTVTVTGGQVFPVVVEDVPQGWRVTSWG